MTMRTTPDADTTERQFFAALLAADAGALNEILAEDFLLIDVMSGSEIPKSVLLAVIDSGQLQFAAIERLESRIRVYGSAAVANGRTEMSGSFAGTTFSASSRYTHVYIEQQGRWRMVAAQGTPIAAADSTPSG
jgi:ketosteroid isomerase-like protein